MIIEEENYLAHYGILRRSGRYPWGSGGQWGDSGTETPAQRSKSLLDYIKQMLGLGLTEVQIAQGLGMTTTELRAARSIARNEVRQSDILMAQRLKDKGYSNGAIATRMGLSGESQVRALLKPGESQKMDVLQTTANMLRDQVDSKGLIDVGAGTEVDLGLSRTKLDTAMAMLKEEGYVVHNGIKVDQATTGNKTEYKVLAPPGTTWGDVMKNRHNIQLINEFTEDGGLTYLGIEPPTSIKSSRVEVRYAEDGGTAADGVIYVRPGVDDVSLGKSQYAQVRIAVDGTHYIKGMAVYKDDLPAGVDLVFNTNKTKDVPMMGPKDNSVLKALKDDPDNPFGAQISRQHGVMNVIREEGSWEGWSKNLSTQMLSKQSRKLAQEQLDMAYNRKKSEYDEIAALTNPAVRKKLLESFADDADSAAVHMKAAGLPRTANHVIMPVSSMRDTEIYAPNYKNGERVVLIRHPHGGIFEIPELTVNNNQPEARRLLGRARDAVGINSRVAERLSGADFDGDHVLVIPNNSGKVKTAPALAGLKNFDPKREYPGYEGMKPMTSRQTQMEMGIVSNLITDMTIRGANETEIAAAVRHSMVVIDAEKHGLNYRESARVNGISKLKAKYQGKPQGGASTIISRAKSEVSVPERKPRSAAKGGPVDRATGKKVYEYTGRTYTDRKGNVVRKTTKSTKLAEADDAYSLSSGTPIEAVYASHSNKLKALANEARKEAVNTKTTPYSPSAKKTYAKEVASLEAKLNLAKRHAPLERRAQIIADSVYRAKKEADPEMDRAEQKKVRAQALRAARLRTGAKPKVEIGWDEWNAIQAGAISNNKLSQLLNNADLDEIKQLATPKTPTLMDGSKSTRAKSMLARGFTQAEVAEQLGVSLTTLKNSLAS